MTIRQNAFLAGFSVCILAISLTGLESSARAADSTVSLAGAQGGRAIEPGGRGGTVAATLDVTTYQILRLAVGGAGDDGCSGQVCRYDNGGGASDVRTGPGLADRILVAPGGGGGSGYAAPEVAGVRWSPGSRAGDGAITLTYHRP